VIKGAFGLKVAKKIRQSKVLLIKSHFCASISYLTSLSIAAIIHSLNSLGEDRSTLERISPLRSVHRKRTLEVDDEVKPYKLLLRLAQTANKTSYRIRI